MATCAAACSGKSSEFTALLAAAECPLPDVIFSVALSACLAWRRKEMAESLRWRKLASTLFWLLAQKPKKDGGGASLNSSRPEEEH
jgi:hypothetical protein